MRRGTITRTYRLAPSMTEEETGPAGGRGADRAHELPAGAAAERPHVSDAASVVPIGDGVPGPPRLRPRALELERLGARRHPARGRGARLLLPQPVPLRLERARGGARRARPARPRRPGADLPALAPVGLDRRAARRRVPRELRHDAPPDRPLLRP